MKRYCPVCFRKISTDSKAKICRHGFKKNRYVLIDKPGDNLREVWIKVDGSPCRGSGKVGSGQSHPAKGYRRSGRPKGQAQPGRSD